MKKGLVVGIFLVGMVYATSLFASPLYGGYNGQSGSWIDLYLFAIDDQARWWVRVPLVLSGDVLRLTFKYESTGIVSAEVVVKGLPGQGDLLFGIDTTGLTWQEINELAYSGGFDSNGNSWTEETIEGVLGTGSDSNGNLWGFVGYYIQNTLPVRAGIDLAFLTPEPSPERKLFLPQKEYRELTSPPGSFQKEECARLLNFLGKLSLRAELRREVETLTAHSLDLEVLLEFANEEVFTQERREIVENMVSGFVSAPSH